MGQALRYEIKGYGEGDHNELLEFCGAIIDGFEDWLVDKLGCERAEDAGFPTEDPDGNTYTYGDDFDRLQQVIENALSCFAVNSDTAPDK